MDKKTIGSKSDSGVGALAKIGGSSANQLLNAEVVNKQLLDKQLEASLKKLVKAVNRLGYTRNPQALSSAAKHCEQVEQMLKSYEQTLLEADAVTDIDSLLLVEAHQMLAEARRLLRAPLEPVVREGNIIELKPNYSDLTDAAFERMLASSDIPTLLSSPLRQQDAEPMHHQDISPSAKPSQQVSLRLVYSRDD